jgi:endonuclease/exonuclease/phosphatase family metal-dependent hydrolase
LSQIIVRTYSIMAIVTSATDSVGWTLTGMYGPQDDAGKQQLMQELQSIKTTAQLRWVLLGDFNLICHASDKNNPRVNRCLMNQFRSVLEDLELKELHLHGHRFTWSNGMANPTLTKIDHVFITKEWELAFPNCYLQALSTSVSDHCPLLITCTPFSRKYRGFSLKQAG